MCVYPVASAAVYKGLSGPQGCCPGGDNANCEWYMCCGNLFCQCCLGIACQPCCGIYVRTKVGQGCIGACLMETICAPVVCAPCAMSRFLAETDPNKYMREYSSATAGADFGDASTNALIL